MKKNALLLLALAAIPLVACNGSQPQDSSSSVAGSSSAEATTSIEENPSEESQTEVDTSEEQISDETSEAASQEGSIEIVDGVALQVPTLVVWKNHLNDADIPTSVQVPGLTFTFDKGSGNIDPKYYGNGDNLRMYVGNTLTIEGLNISSVVFTLSDAADRNGKFSADTGSIEASVDTLTETWTGNANTVTFTVDSKQRRIEKMVIISDVDADIYVAPEEEEEPSDLEGETVYEMLLNFLAIRGVEVENIPFLSTLEDDEVVYLDYSTDFYEEDGWTFCPFFELMLEGDHVNEILTVLEAAQFIIPSEPSPDFGYECYNDFYEMDVLLYEEEGVTYTDICVYALADLEAE